ncbi:Bleomycin hydrolase [Fusarium oxysporum f. sp. albedinis]|nr:Bleomycin hydrolase [Fusarium oxysporum f. sp. albedinis]
MAPFSLQICPIIRDLIFTPRISLLLPERITSNLPLTCRHCKSSTYLSLRNLRTHTRVQDRDLQLFVVKPAIRFYGGALLIVVTSSLRLTSDGGNINVPLSR